MGSNHCFVCGNENPFGLHLTFFQSGEEVVAAFHCEDRHVGWPGIVHGGIIAALLDEASGYVPQYLQLVAMTGKIEVTYMAPILLGEVVRIAGRAIKISRRVVEVEAEITGQDGSIRAKSIATMRVLSNKQRQILGLGQSIKGMEESK